jgi:hypothetical protein
MEQIVLAAGDGLVESLQHQEEVVTVLRLGGKLENLADEGGQMRLDDLFALTKVLHTVEQQVEELQQKCGGLVASAKLLEAVQQERQQQLSEHASDWGRRQTATEQKLHDVSKRDSHKMNRRTAYLVRDLQQTRIFQHGIKQEAHLGAKDILEDARLD